MKKIWIIIAIITVLLGVGAYFLFSGNNPDSSNQSYQAPTVSGSANNTAIQATTKYSGLDLTPTSPQTDSIPSTTNNILTP